MKHSYTRRGVGVQSASTTIAALFIAAGLSACGGEDGSPVAKATNAPAPAAAVVPASGQPAIKVEQRQIDSSTVKSDSLGRVFRLLAPHVSNEYNLAFVNDGLFGLADAKELRERENTPGAYIAFGKHELLAGSTVTDFYSNPNREYAIGRWTKGSDSGSNTYNENQGRVWAVGTPFASDSVDKLVRPTVAEATAWKSGARSSVMTEDASRLLTCSLDEATRPIEKNGNIAPGKVASASAEFRYRGIPGEKSLPVYDFTLNYSQAGKTQLSIQSLGNIYGVSNKTHSHGQVAQNRLISQFVGSNPDAPYLIVSYNAEQEGVGTIYGVVAMKCVKQ